MPFVKVIVKDISNIVFCLQNKLYVMRASLLFQPILIIDDSQWPYFQNRITTLIAPKPSQNGHKTVYQD